MPPPAAPPAPASGDLTLRLDGHTFAFRHPGKPLFPTGETKLDLLRYHMEVAPALLRHLADRPLTFTRFPHGVDGEGFFQKRLPAGSPPWIGTARWGDIDYATARVPADLALFVSWSAIEIHAPLVRVRDERAEVDELVVDLDPMPPAGWRDVQRAARGVRLLLDHAGVRAYPKLSGATGLHVYIPVRLRPAGPAAVDIARGMAGLLAQAAPDVYTVVWSVKDRRGVYVDYNQNAHGHTMAAPYAVRALPGAPVSTPVTWDEVGELASAQAFTIRTVPERLSRRGDLFAGALGPPQPAEALEDLYRAGARRAAAPASVRSAGRSGS